jgi:hypothetical protein
VRRDSWRLLGHFGRAPLQRDSQANFAAVAQHRKCRIPNRNAKGNSFYLQILYLRMLIRRL